MKVSNKLVGLIKGWLNIFIIYKEIYININIYIIILDDKFLTISSICTRNKTLKIKH